MLSMICLKAYIGKIRRMIIAVVIVLASSLHGHGSIGVNFSLSCEIIPLRSWVIP